MTFSDVNSNIRASSSPAASDIVSCFVWLHAFVFRAFCGCMRLCFAPRPVHPGKLAGARPHSCADDNLSPRNVSPGQTRVPAPALLLTRPLSGPARCILAGLRAHAFTLAQMTTFPPGTYLPRKLSSLRPHFCPRAQSRLPSRQDTHHARNPRKNSHSSSIQTFASSERMSR